MLRHISSRQRIASWDIFDTSSHSSNGSTDEDYETCISRISSMASLNASCHFTSSPLLGKRVRRVSLDIQNPRHMQHFIELVSDVQLSIISFLSVEDAKKVMCTNKYMHHLIQNQTFLWKQWCFQQWPNLPRDAVFVDESDKYSNDSIPFTKRSFKFSAHKVSLRQSTLLKTASLNSVEPNYSKLLKQRAHDYPTIVDQSVPRIKITRPPTVFSVLAPTKIQFTGTVGTGDRCIRSDKPLARPEQESRRRFLTFLCRGESKYKPFCSPFVDKRGTIHLTPRLVAYFEVTIMSPSPLTTLQQTTPNDCVAIGLSRREFRTHGRMPGWDDLSYGYHGDDGTLSQWGRYDPTLWTFFWSRRYCWMRCRLPSWGYLFYPERSIFRIWVAAGRFGCSVLSNNRCGYQQCFGS